MASGSGVTIDSLPPELLIQIFGYVAADVPSGTRLHDQPRIGMLGSPDTADPSKTPLKTASLVCKRWREITLSALFTNVVWHIDRHADLNEPIRYDPDAFRAFPLLAFLSDNDLARHVDSLTLVVPYATIAADTATEPTSSGPAVERVRNVATEGLLGPIQPELHPVVNQAVTYNQDYNWLWEILFSVVDPNRFSLIASPQVLASLFSRRLYLGDAWHFKRELLHIVSLSRDKPRKAAASASSASSSAPGSNQKSRLFTIRPWTRLLLNEGSFVPIYRSYEFFLRRPPSILGALLGCEQAPNNVPLMPSTVNSLSYIAIFPLASHFNTLVNFLPPKLDNLFVQLVPGKNNDILRNRAEMLNVQPADLWMERNSCYSMILRELLVNTDDDSSEDNNDNHMDAGDAEHVALNQAKETNWRHLRVFESGDAADKEAWDMAVERINNSRVGWRVEQDGVLVKGEPEARPDIHDLDEDEDEVVELFQGDLVRLAFHGGTERLPYGPLHDFMPRRTPHFDDYSFDDFPDHLLPWNSYMDETDLELEEMGFGFGYPPPGSAGVEASLQALQALWSASNTFPTGTVDTEEAENDMLQDPFGWDEAPYMPNLEFTHPEHTELEDREWESYSDSDSDSDLPSLHVEGNNDTLSGEGNSSLPARVPAGFISAADWDSVFGTIDDEDDVVVDRHEPVNYMASWNDTLGELDVGGDDDDPFGDETMTDRDYSIFYM